MPGGPKLTPSDPEKKKVMEKWVNQGAMIMRSAISPYHNIICNFSSPSFYVTNIGSQTNTIGNEYDAR